MKKKTILSVITAVATLFLLSCELEFYTFTAPESAETESLITLDLAGRAIDNGDAAAEYGVILQIPADWKVVSGSAHFGVPFPNPLTEQPAYALEYTPEPGYKIWVGTILQTPWKGDKNVSCAINVLTGNFPGDFGDKEYYTLKAAAGAFRNGQWVTDDPFGEFDFTFIVDDLHVESIELTKVEDVTAPAPVSNLDIYNEARNRAAIHIDWSDYDEAAQGDVAGYRIYRYNESFSNVTGMEFIEAPAGAAHATVVAPSPGAWYFAVTAVDENFNEDQTVAPVLFRHQAFHESFETGDFGWLPWILRGEWRLDVSDDAAHRGNYTARSPALDHGETASMETTLACADGELSFLFAMDSEENSDYLTFYVDGASRGQWSGAVDYTRAAVAISRGVHTFTWEYRKDASNSAGADAVWLDDIVFPLLDSDEDGTPDDFDECPDDFIKVEPGSCGCRRPDRDSDDDGVLDCNDMCPDDPDAYINFYYRDNDKDGFGDPLYRTLGCPLDGFVDNNLDCDDADASVHPGAEEICNGRDDNCSARIDEGCARGDENRQ